ncbi:MAG: CvpA family protein [Eubacterium sp.]|nr:CvpA family protein [Eubacterium sp.]
MNWLVIVVLIILLWNVIRGARKGFIKVIFSLVSMVVVLGFAVIATPRISNYLIEKTEIYHTIEEKCEQKIKERAAEKIESEGNSLESLLNEIGIVLPGETADHLGSKVGGAVQDTLETTGVYAQASAMIARAIVNGISFLIALIIGALIVAIIRKLLDLLTDLPGLKTVNRALGVVAGAVQGLIIVWVLLYIVGIVAGFDTTGGMMAMINESKLLTWLYDNNLLVRILGFFLK